MSVYIIHKRRINVGLRRAPEETVGLFKRFFQRKILIAKFLIWKCSWHETDITSTAHVKIPKHSFLHFALGNVSGLFAGGRVFPTLFLQYTRCQPHLIEVCWECQADSFASAKDWIVKLKARRLICYVAVAWYSTEPRHESQFVFKFDKGFSEQFRHGSCSNSLYVGRSRRIIVNVENCRWTSQEVSPRAGC